MDHTASEGQWHHIILDQYDEIPLRILLSKSKHKREQLSFYPKTHGGSEPVMPTWLEQLAVGEWIITVMSHECHCFSNQTPMNTFHFFLQIQTFSLMKRHLKLSSAKSRLRHLGCSMLRLGSYSCSCSLWPQGGALRVRWHLWPNLLVLRMSYNISESNYPPKIILMIS